MISNKILTTKTMLGLRSVLRPLGKLNFIRMAERNASLLDVGCGNMSLNIIKHYRPDLELTGIDIVDLIPPQNTRFIKFESAKFDLQLDELRRRKKFNYIISSHNIEHVENQESTLKAIIDMLEVGGRLYLSTPSESSLSFPNRIPTLNYYDDHSHINLPMSIQKVRQIVNECGASIDRFSVRYRPPVPWLLGCLFEPLSRLRSRAFHVTWDFYGFEQIYWITKNEPSRQNYL